MQAFGPFPECEVIDFRDAVEAGLFGIYGQTGAGKSTIFSSMTFALFGESAKTDQDTPSLRSDHADAGVPTEVEFVFDIGERRYVVLRRPDQMRPKQRGDGETRSSHEAFLFDATGLALDDIREGQRGKIIAEKKVRDIDAAISEMLGYRPLHRGASDAKHGPARGDPRQAGANDNQRQSCAMPPRSRQPPVPRAASDAGSCRFSFDQ